MWMSESLWAVGKMMKTKFPPIHPSAHKPLCERVNVGYQRTLPKKSHTLIVRYLLSLYNVTIFISIQSCMDFLLPRFCFGDWKVRPLCKFFSTHPKGSQGG